MCTSKIHLDVEQYIRQFLPDLEGRARRMIIRTLTCLNQYAVFAWQVKPFPWPETRFDVGAVLAAAAFNLLLVFAFLAPTRAAVAAVVREKELRLREGMRIFGLQVVILLALISLSWICNSGSLAAMTPLAWGPMCYSDGHACYCSQEPAAGLCASCSVNVVMAAPVLRTELRCTRACAFSACSRVSGVSRL